jgi:ribosome-associated protein
MVSGGLEVGAAQPIPVSELRFRFSRSGGPGGQHVNTSSTRVELVFDLLGSPSLTDSERARATRRLGSRVEADGTLRVIAQDERSQLRNRELATSRLEELLRDALRPPPPPRRPTKPTRSSKEQRLDSKRRAGQQKRLRRPPSEPDG